MLCILNQLKLSKAALYNRQGIKWIGHEWLAEWSPNLGKGGFGTPNEALQKSKTARAAIFSWKLWEQENSQVIYHVWLGNATPSKIKYGIFPDLPSGGLNIYGCLVLVGLSHKWFLPIQTCTTRGTGKEPWQVPHSSGLELKGIFGYHCSINDTKSQSRRWLHPMVSHSYWIKGGRKSCPVAPHKGRI